MKARLQIKSGFAVAGLIVALAATISTGAAVIQVPAQYPTIQAAVDAAASGDEIRIAPGIYTEQTVIRNKKLTLRGSSGAVIQADPTMVQTLLPEGSHQVALLGIVDAGVVVSDLDFEGGHLADAFPARGYLAIKCYGANVRVERCTVRGFRRSSGIAFSDSVGFTALNPVSSTSSIVQVLVARCLFEDNEGAIAVLGDDVAQPDSTRTRFSICDNTVVGFGPTDTGSQSGIVIGTGASGEIKHNTVTKHVCAGVGGISSGIDADDTDAFNGLRLPVPLQPIVVEGNDLRDNQVHLLAFLANGSRIIDNHFGPTTASYRSGGVGLSGDDFQVIGNSFSDMPIGVLLAGEDPDFGTFLGITTNAKLVENRFCSVTDPIVVEPLATGTVEHNNRLNDCRPQRRDEDQDQRR